MRAWTGRLALLLVALLVSLGAAELYMRSFYTFAPLIQLGTGGNRLSDEVVHSLFEADPVTMWRMRAGLAAAEEHFAFRGLLSNPQRVRSTVIIPAQKAPNEIRILFLGDSVTFGWGVRLEETFADRTEKMLDERFPELTFTSINAGVPGFALLQGYRLLEAEGWNYRPDLVVVDFGSNDLVFWGAGDKGDFELFKAWESQQPPDWLAWSSLARLASNALWSRRAPDKVTGPRRPRLTPEEFTELLKRMREESRVHGAALLIMVSAYRVELDGTRNYRDHYQRVAIELGNSLRLGATREPALVDSIALFKDALAGGDPSQVLMDHVHPNAAGHEVLAQALVAHIAPWIEERKRMGEFAGSARERVGTR